MKDKTKIILREIYPGVKVDSRDAQAFIEDMLQMEAPVWKWIIRIGGILSIVNLVILFRIMIVMIG